MENLTTKDLSAEDNYGYTVKDKAFQNCQVCEQMVLGFSFSGAILN